MPSIVSSTIQLANITGTVHWADGSNFQGWLVFVLALPTHDAGAVWTPGTYPKAYISVSQMIEIPQRVALQVVDGQIDQFTQIIQNASIQPPNSKYYVYFVDQSGNYQGDTGLGLITVNTNPFPLSNITLSLAIPVSNTAIPPLNSPVLANPANVTQTVIAPYVGGPTGTIVVNNTPNPPEIDIDTTQVPTLAQQNTFTGRNLFSGSTNIVPGAAPGAPVDGDIWYDNALHKFRVRENGVSTDWVAGGGGGSGASTDVPGATGTLVKNTSVSPYEWDVDIAQVPLIASATNITALWHFQSNAILSTKPADASLANGEGFVYLKSDTQAAIRFKGSDGVVREGVITIS